MEAGVLSEELDIQGLYSTEENQGGLSSTVWLREPIRGQRALPSSSPQLVMDTIQVAHRWQPQCSFSPPQNACHPPSEDKEMLARNIGLREINTNIYGAYSVPGGPHPLS